MGSSESKEEKKTVDSTGTVNNNIIVQEAEDTHSQLLINEKILLAAYIMCAIEIIKLLLYTFLHYQKHMKKKYEKKPANRPTGGV